MLSVYKPFLSGDSSRVIFGYTLELFSAELYRPLRRTTRPPAEAMVHLLLRDRSAFSAPQIRARVWTLVEEILCFFQGKDIKEGIFCLDFFWNASSGNPPTML